MLIKKQYKYKALSHTFIKVEFCFVRYNEEKEISSEMYVGSIMKHSASC